MRSRTLRRLLHRFRHQLATAIGHATSTLASALHLPQHRHRFHFARIRGRR